MGLLTTLRLCRHAWAIRHAGGHRFGSLAGAITTHSCPLRWCCLLWPQCCCRNRNSHRIAIRLLGTGRVNDDDNAAAYQGRPRSQVPIERLIAPSSARVAHCIRRTKCEKTPTRETHGHRSALVLKRRRGYGLKISTSDRTHARTGPDTPRAQAQLSAHILAPRGLTALCAASERVSVQPCTAPRDGDENQLHARQARGRPSELVRGVAAPSTGPASPWSRTPRGTP